MKKRLHLLLSIFFSLIILSKTNAQMVITGNDTIPVYERFVRLGLEENKGVIQWESSLNGIDWQKLPDEKAGNLIVDVANTGFYRAKVTADNCAPYYSDTTIIKTGQLIPRKSEIFSNEICFVQPNYIKFKDSVLTGFVSGDTVNIVVLNNSLVFAIPQQYTGNQRINVTINEIEYSLDFSVQDPPEIENPEVFVSEVINETNLQVETIKTDLQELIIEYPDFVSTEEFDNIFSYADSLSNEISLLLDSLTSEQIEALAVMLTANSGLYSYPKNLNKSAYKDILSEELPEKRLELLSPIIYDYANDLSYINDGLDVFSQAGTAKEEFKEEILQGILSKVSKGAVSAFKILENMAKLFSTTNAYDRINRATYLMQNVVYLLDEDLAPTWPQPFSFINKNEIETSFWAKYRCFTLGEITETRFTEINSALEEFNKEFNVLLADEIIVILGIYRTDFSKKFPVEPRVFADLVIDYEVPVEYIKSTTEKISTSISNGKVSLNSFKKKQNSIEISFFTNELEEQTFTWNLEYKHKNYNSRSTTLSGIANARLPATLKIHNPDNINLVGKPDHLLPYPIQVIVEDLEGNPVPGLSILFYTECEDCGYLLPTMAITNENGIAETKWALGKNEGLDFAKAKLIDYETIEPVEFAATAKIHEPASFSVIASTNNQTGKHEEALPKPIQVEVKDKNNNPVEGIAIEFYTENEGNGNFNPVTTATNAEGIAQTIWTLGASGEQLSAKARVLGYNEIPPVELFATANDNVSLEPLIGKWKLKDGAGYIGDSGNPEKEWLEWGCNLKTQFECFADGKVEGHYLYHENVCEDNEIGLIKNGKWEKNEAGEFKISFNWYSERENYNYRTEIFDYGTITFPSETSMQVVYLFTQVVWGEQRPFTSHLLYERIE